MKKLFLISLLFASASAFGQLAKRSSVSYCDPSVSNLQFTDEHNNPVNINKLTIGQTVRLWVTINNNTAQNTVPKGTCQLMITLGTHFKVRKDFSVIGQPLPLEDIIKWKSCLDDEGAQYIITGELIQDMPARYAERVYFDLTAIKEGGSVLTCQVLITNHKNDKTVLSDILPSNNFVFSDYKTVKPFAMKFEKLDAVPHGCTLELNWKVLDANKEAVLYNIEASEDGINFRTIKTVAASGGPAYNLMLENLTGNSLYVRIKAEAATGQFLYSDVAYIEKICNSGFDVGLYPNPVPAEIKEVMLVAKTGIFNGKYQILLTDVSGKTVQNINVVYANQLQVKIDLGFIITPGVYNLSVKGEDGKTQVLKFVRQR